MKVFFAIGNDEIEDMLKLGDYEVVDSEDNLTALYDLLDYIQIDGLIINRLLDSDGTQIIKIAERAWEKDIKVIVIINDFEEYEEQKLVTALVHHGATAYIKFKDLTAELATKTFRYYPEQFDFGLFSKARVEYREVVKSVFKEVITVYSPRSEGSSTVASHLAAALAGAKDCRVCLVDFNPLKPDIKAIYDMTGDYTLSHFLEEVTKGTLTTEKVECLTKQSKYQKNLDLVFGLYDLNDYYVSKLDQYEEILEKLKFNYDYVIVDAHSWYDVLPTDAALRKADRIVVPVRGNRYSLEELQRYFEMFEKYQDYDTRKFGIVINQYGPSDLTSIEINAKLKYPVLGYITYNNGYREKNCFQNRKLLNEYIDILNNLGINAKKKNSFTEALSRLISRKTG